MKSISASKFKAQCLALIDRVSNEGLVITKRGRPVARLVPIESENRELVGSLKDKLQVHGDIMSTGEFKIQAN